jgi:hypothetical protein
MMNIDANLAVYLAARTPTDRYASFDYCFNYFQSQFEDDDLPALADAPGLQMSCLHLGFYLASWGMYRGSTVRLQRSLAYLTPAVSVIAAAPREVWASDINHYTDDVCAALIDVGHRLRAAFPEGASDTLVTKVMLGVFGCVPAFDTYFRTGFRAATGFRVSGLNRPALQRISSFYEENAEVIERYRVPTLDFDTGSETTRRYSRAKVIDMIFFVEGAK